ncbi:MAG: hypothetical protein Q9166_000016 [cf. Caloplaca sp. 2 TL-2023]
MDHDTKNTVSPVDQILRPFKRRKFYRKRAESPHSNEAVPAGHQYSSSGTPNLLPTEQTSTKVLENAGEDDGTDDPSTLPVTAILRRRRTAQRRRAGIEFTNATAVPESSKIQAATGDELLYNEDSLDKILTVVDRFAPQTGQVADIDKHMYATSNVMTFCAKDANTNGVRMAYIDSELAKRRQSHRRPVATSNDQESDDESVDGAPADLAKHRQPAALGKLHEIDLGADATLKNIARTEAAKRRLEGGELEVEEANNGKVRLRRDGKLWRGRRRRNSDDIKRDRLVEEVLKESRLEIYDEPEVELPNDDQAADDRIAEQFRREFMDAISSRRQKAAQLAKKGPGAKVDDKPKGPKLGGSRSARAAMREQQEKAAKK